MVGPWLGAAEKASYFRPQKFGLGVLVGEPTNADAGVGIGMKRGIQKCDKKKH